MKNTVFLSIIIEMFKFNNMNHRSRGQQQMDKDEMYMKIAEYLKDQGAKKVSIFGSYVYDEERPDSDIDVLVIFSDSKSLLDLARIERELSELIGIKVDLLTEGALSPYIKDNVHKEMIEVYG